MKGPRSRSSRALLVGSSLVALGLTVDVGSRAYDRMYPDANGLRSLYAALPLRAASRVWGSVADSRVPPVLRAPLYRTYAWVYGVKLDEVRDPLESFRSVQDFFTRRLRDGVRPVVQRGLASPVDGRVMSCGPVDMATRMLPTVKGFTYSLDEFVGANDLAKPEKSGGRAALPAKPPKPLYQIVLYLAPGDYHGFHAPADLVLTERRHFAGRLLPVAPWMVGTVPALLAVNERVVLFGTYRDGANSGTILYAPVGATNVGSIDLSLFDAAVVTNRASDAVGTKHWARYDRAVSIARGAEMGFFRMGSTVVMVFEAGPAFRFAVGAGDTVQLGQLLGQ